MAGEQIAFRRVALGIPIAGYARIMDRARVNKGGAAVGNDTGADAAASTVNKTVTADAVAHTKGVYTEMITSTSVAGETITFGVYTALGATGIDSSTLLDIAFGAAASEVVKIANIPIGFVRAFTTYSLPFAVPAGTRVAFRIQSAVGGQALSMGCEVKACGDFAAPPTVATTYNANTTTSNVTTVATVPGGLNTESAWTELVATTTADMTRILVVPTGPANNAHTTNNALIDIAYGGSGSEVPIVSNVPVILSATEIISFNLLVSPYAANVPAGSRLAMRYQANTSAATGARPNVVLIGFGN